MRGNHPRRFANTARPIRRRQPVWPFEARIDFGISVSGMKVTVAPGLIYRAGYAYETTETEITLSSSYLWIAVKVVPGSTRGSDTISIVRYDAAGLPMDDNANGYIYRALHKFSYVAASTGIIEHVEWLRSSLGLSMGMMDA